MGALGGQREPQLFLPQRLHVKKVSERALEPQSSSHIVKRAQRLKATEFTF